VYVLSKDDVQIIELPLLEGLSKNAVELASADLYDIDSDAPTAINRDDSCEAEEILNAASSKGIAKDAETPMKPSLGPGSGGKTPNTLNHSDSALQSKVKVSLELRFEVRSHTHYSLMQS
jgi:hypothetical protein